MMYLAIFVAAVVMMVIGAVRYSPAMFGNVWMKQMGINPEDMKDMSGVGKMYAAHFVLNLMQLAVFAAAIRYLEIADYKTLVYIVLVAWFALSAVPMAGGMIREGKSLTLYAINALYQVCALVIATVVLFAMMSL